MSQAGVLINSMIPPGLAIQTIQGNINGPVSPNGANNIFVKGDGVTVLVSGDPGTNTLTISATGSIVLAYTNVATTPYVVLPTDDYLSVDISVTSIIIQLPDTATLGRTFVIKDRTGSATEVRTITVTTVSGIVTIDGSTTFVIDNPFQAVSVLGNGTNYEAY